MVMFAFDPPGQRAHEKRRLRHLEEAGLRMTMDEQKRFHEQKRELEELDIASGRDPISVRDLKSYRWKCPFCSRLTHWRETSNKCTECGRPQFHETVWRAMKAASRVGVKPLYAMLKEAKLLSQRAFAFVEDVR
jgi:hypothetical protein